MKKAAFGWVTIVYLFDSMEEIKEFRTKNRNKYWHYGTPTQEKNGRWYLEVHKPYGKYNTGW